MNAAPASLVESPTPRAAEPFTPSRGDSPPSRLGTPGNPVKLRRTPSPIIENLGDTGGEGGGGGGGSAEGAPLPRAESDDETVKEDVAFQLGRALLNVNEPWATEMYEQLLSPEGLSFEEQYEGIRHFSYQIQLWAALNELRDLPDFPDQNAHRAQIRLRMRHHALAYIQFRFNEPSLAEVHMNSEQKAWFQQFIKELQTLHTSLRDAPSTLLTHASLMPENMVDMQFAYMAPFLEKVTALTSDIARVFPHTQPETPASTRRRKQWDEFRFGKTCLTVTKPGDRAALEKIKASNSLMSSEGASSVSFSPRLEASPSVVGPTARRLDFAAESKEGPAPEAPADSPSSAGTPKKRALAEATGLIGIGVGVSFAPTVAPLNTAVTTSVLETCKLVLNSGAQAIIAHSVIPILILAAAAAACYLLYKAAQGVAYVGQYCFRKYAERQNAAAVAPAPSL